MFLIPYRIDLIIKKIPTANLYIIGSCVFMFIVSNYSSLSDWTIEHFILDGWGPTGIFGHMFLHAGILHLIGNMIYLWVFGNAVCSRIGDSDYLLLFFSLGIFAAVIHLIFNGSPAVGASGAIYGIIGFYLAIYPKNRITCRLWLFIKLKDFQVPSYLLIGFWVLKDLFGLLNSGSNIAHVAHLGGFFGGLLVGYWLVDKGHIPKCWYDSKTLPEIVGK